MVVTAFVEILIFEILYGAADDALIVHTEVASDVILIRAGLVEISRLALMLVVAKTVVVSTYEVLNGAEFNVLRENLRTLDVLVKSPTNAYPFAIVAFNGTHGSLALASSVGAVVALTS